ncbi:Homeobox-leucine zipper protein ROC4 [Acorus calamus]|uniref:Homeobox-leucine zipper protein ROC4 n=1 Tax=Acorus calamus TaxID=4465 RepID=A0AAV9C840_ACOCL|nr:Homeobox-leucine zipper protein ROC4 [Acorus calamus]
MNNYKEMGFPFSNHQATRIVGEGRNGGVLGNYSFNIGVTDVDYDGLSGSGSTGDSITGVAAININSKNDDNNYQRYTKEQIEVLQNIFDRCPNPDEKERRELSQLLKLSKSQIKFWFQNRRSYMKIQMERQENSLLKEENERIRKENEALMERMSKHICSNCRGDNGESSSLLLFESSMQELQLREENACIGKEIQQLITQIETKSRETLPIPMGHVPPQQQSGVTSSHNLNIATNDLGLINIINAPVGNANFTSGGFIGPSSSSAFRLVTPHSPTTTFEFVKDSSGSSSTEPLAGPPPNMDDLATERVSTTDGWLGGMTRSGGSCSES